MIAVDHIPPFQIVGARRHKRKGQFFGAKDAAVPDRRFTQCSRSIVYQQSNVDSIGKIQHVRVTLASLSSPFAAGTPKDFPDNIWLQLMKKCQRHHDKYFSHSLTKLFARRKTPQEFMRERRKRIVASSHDHDAVATTG